LRIASKIFLLRHFRETEENGIRIMKLPALPLKSALLMLLTQLSLLFAQPAIETASFINFMTADEPACTYDNWVSHVVEGIARPGYNVYAPNDLDPQLNGFGAFELITDDEEGDEILSVFSDLFEFLLNDSPQAAWDLLQAYPELDYELVEIQDASLGRSFFVLRELLDADYLDPGNTPSIADDVLGSFNKGWGIFVFSPSASRPQIVVEAPHPNDDHLSPFIAVDFFCEADAGLLMINGAGRELAWSGANYTNGASLSDPSRNCRLPFALAHDMAVAHWRAQFMQECVLQIHSYDDLSHRDLKSCVVSGGRYRRFNLPPIYDPGRTDLGMINNLSHPVWGTNSLGFAHASVGIPAFAATQSFRPLRVNGDLGDIMVPTSVNLWGYPHSCQELCSHDDVPDCNRLEEWIHIELDELPLPAHSVGDATWYGEQGEQVASMENYFNTLRYFEPLFDGFLEAWDALQTVTETNAPTAPSALSLTSIHNDGFAVKWEPTRSSFFSSYEFLMDPSGEITEDAVIYDDHDFDELCWAPLDRLEFEDLDYHQLYALAVRGVDAQGRVSELSNVLLAMPDDLEPPKISIPMTPQALWLSADGGEVRVRFMDVHHCVDLTSIEWRLDASQDGQYDGPFEQWVSAPHEAFVDDTTLVFSVGPLLAGEHAVEWRAHDDQHATFGYSGRLFDEGIDDDHRLIVDPDEPAPFDGGITAQVQGNGRIQLNWSTQASDTTFFTYRIYFSRTLIETPADAEFQVDRSLYADLGDLSTRSLEIDPNEWPGESVHLAMDMVDFAGNTGALSEDISFMNFHPSWCMTLVQAESAGNCRVRLSWQTECFWGNLPIEGYWVHQLETPFEQPQESNRIAFTADCSYLVQLNPCLLSAFYKVVPVIALP
jgi:hypothetical protein